MWFQFSTYFFSLLSPAVLSNSATALLYDKESPSLLWEVVSEEEKSKRTILYSWFLLSFVCYILCRLWSPEIHSGPEYSLINQTQEILSKSSQQTRHLRVGSELHFFSPSKYIFLFLSWGLCFIFCDQRCCLSVKGKGYCQQLRLGI